MVFQTTDLGRRMERSRKAAGLGLDDVAKRLDCSADRIRSFEVGKSVPPAIVMERLSNLYGVSLLSFFGDEAGAESDESILFAETRRLVGAQDQRAVLKDLLAPRLEDRLVCQSGDLASLSLALSCIWQDARR